MRRVWIALAAILGFAVGFAVVFAIGVEATSEWECDGPCFDKWDEVSYFAYGGGVAAAIAFGLAARAFLNRAR